MNKLDYFTPKEQEVLDYMADCYTYAEISMYMGISKKTLLKHIEKIGLKAGIRTQLPICRYAQDQGYGKRQRVVAR